jgi:uncharacterized protein YggE
VLTRLIPPLTLVLSVAALFAAAPGAAAQTVPAQPQTGISVLGSGIVLADPNVARITFGSEVFDASLSNAQAEASRRMDAVVTKLKADGIQETDIRTTSFNINPQYDLRDQSQPAVLRGYTVQNQVEVKTTNVAGLGALIDDAVGVGATRVFGIRFEASNMEALKNQARDQAMQNARAKAEQLAKDSGITLGRPISIEESDTGGVTPLARQADSSLAAAPAAVSTPIQPGQLQVSTNVRVIFSIQ